MSARHRPLDRRGHAHRRRRRARRALQEALLVFDDLGWAADADGLAVVYSEDGEEHHVDVSWTATSGATWRRSMVRSEKLATTTECLFHRSVYS